MKKLSHSVSVNQSKANSSNLSDAFAKTKEGTINNGGQPRPVGAPGGQADVPGAGRNQD